MQKIVKNKIIERELFSKVAKHLSKSEITLITGARQVGKTTLLEMLEKWLIKEKNIASENIFYYNLDIIKDW